MLNYKYMQMKTDVVEIFQTIRAAMQPYATLGFTNRINSDEEYDLWSDKNIVSEAGEGLDRNETFFACVKIEGNLVHFILSSNEGHDIKNTQELTELDEMSIKQIEDNLSVAYKLFKEREWI